MRDKHGNILFSKNSFVDMKSKERREPQERTSHLGKGLTELDGSINRVGGVPDRDSRMIRHKSHQYPPEISPSNFKVTPKVLLAENQRERVLRSVSMPTKKFNNLKFEL